MTTTNQLRAIGFNNEVTECDACGRMELRGTVILTNEDGDLMRMGTTCASRATGTRISRQDALSQEAIRRNDVVNELRAAWRAFERGDMPAAQMYLDGAKNIGIVRSDELKLAAKMEITNH